MRPQVCSVLVTHKVNSSYFYRSYWLPNIHIVTGFSAEFIIQRKHAQNMAGKKHILCYKLTILVDCRSEAYSRMGMCVPPGGVADAVPLTGCDIGLFSSESTRFSSLRPTIGTFSESVPFFCGCKGMWKE